MKLSTKSRYGARILIELAMYKNNGAVQVKKIASGQKIPIKYLEQLLRLLKRAGYVKSFRGPKSGYLLAMDPSQISLGQLVRLLEGQSDLFKFHHLTAQVFDNGIKVLP